MLFVTQEQHFHRLKYFTIAPGNDYLDTIVNCIHSMNSAIKYTEAFKDKNYYCLNYDKLTENPELILNELCTRLKIPFEDDLLNLEKVTNKNGELWKGNSSYKKKYNNISSVASKAWQDKLQKWEIQLVETLSFKLMDKFGFTPVLVDEEIDYNKIIKEVIKSNLSNHGLLNLLLTNNGIERFPLDPLNKDSWQKESDNYK